MLEKDILDSLDDLEYDKNGKERFDESVFADASSIEFTDLVHWLSTELQKTCKLDERIEGISNESDIQSFQLEVSSFLKEINCPYKSLMEGPIAQRLVSRENRLQLLNFLCTELQAARLATAIVDQSPKSKRSTMQITESDTAADLRSMLISLSFPKPPPTISAQQLFDKLGAKVKEQISKVPKEHLGNPLFVGTLNGKQWETLAKINDSMNNEYKGREDMLLKRLDVTVQSFSWSERVKKQEDELLKVFRPIRQNLKACSKISTASLLAARTDLLSVEKTSGERAREKTKSKINKVLMQGKVPDRGGRPTEIEPPPPEMPSWQQRQPGRGGHRGGGGGPQAPRQQNVGSRVQGSWSGGGGGQKGYARNSNQPYYAQQGGQYQSGDYGSHQLSYPTQQGAAHYQDFYNTGVGYQQQQQVGNNDDRYQKRGRGGSRGGYR